MYINKTQILGNLTRDPELKALPSGAHVCSFSVATNKVFMQDGQKKEKVEFHNIICFGKTADNVAKYMTKGSQIYIDGELQTRSWDDTASGKKLYRTEILANNVQFGHKPGGASASAPKVEGQDVSPGGYTGDLPDDTGEVNNDDIPF